MLNPLSPFFDSSGWALLDGGMATELEARGADLTGELWSASSLIEAPDLVRSVHADYYSAGADCATSATYQASFAGLARHGFDTRSSEALMRRAVELAQDARDAFWARAEHEVSGRFRHRLRPLVAASIGPYGAALADGSEYTGTYDLDLDGLRSFHQHRWEVLASSGADLLACETIPSANEARALARLLQDTPGTWAWISFQCRDGGHLADGSDLARLAAELDTVPRIAALGVNCVPPERVLELLSKLREATTRPLVVYPNSGDVWDAEARAWRPRATPLDYGAAARRWVDAGAHVVGGCCRTTPADLRSMREALVATPE